MLWFAADTRRGAALEPGPARRRGAHRGGGAGKNARFLGVLAAWLTGMAVLLAFFVYQVIFGVSLAFYVVLLLIFLAGLAGDLLRRRRYWFSAGGVALAAGGGAAHLAGHLGWGHPLLFTLISACGYAVGAACISMAGAIAIRSARRNRRLGIQERSDREQLPGPARAAGMSAQLRGSSGGTVRLIARWLAETGLMQQLAAGEGEPCPGDVLQLDPGPCHRHDGGGHVAKAYFVARPDFRRPGDSHRRRSHHRMRIHRTSQEVTT
jgi:hypothetical protein